MGGGDHLVGAWTWSCEDGIWTCGGDIGRRTDWRIEPRRGICAGLEDGRSKDMWRQGGLVDEERLAGCVVRLDGRVAVGGA